MQVRPCEWVPAGHVVQRVLPTPLAKVFSPQHEQPTELVTALKVPEGQNEHVTEPVVLVNMPGPQGRHEDCPARI